MAKYKHLTLSERVEIYALLKANKSIRKIAKELKRDPTTISKEIKSIWKFVKRVAVGDHSISVRSRISV